MSSFDELVPLLRELLPNANVCSGDPSICLRSCVASYLKATQDNADLAIRLNSMEVVEAFVLCCTHLLIDLAHTKSPDGDDRPVFSVCQSQQLTTCVEFIVCLGIYPYLSPGVSAPLEMRLEHANKFICPKPQDCSDRHTKLFGVSAAFDVPSSNRLDFRVL